jgi:uncharacterized membrane protein YfcA
VNLRALLASPLGFLIGLSLGALGGGGSILAVPALVYVVGQTPKEATATSLVLVAITAMVGIVPHWRAGRVRVVPGVLFGLAGVAGNLVASQANKSVNPNVLLLAFSGIMLVAAAAMWRRSQADRRRHDAVLAEAARAEGAAVTVAPARTALHVDATMVAKVVLLGTAVGALTGFFGVGGGFVIVPALVLAMGFSMPEAVGTSLLVISINSAVALTTRVSGDLIDWGVVVPFTVASVLGVFSGSRLAGKVRSDVLSRWFVFLLVGVALYTAVDAALALWS